MLATNAATMEQRPVLPWWANPDLWVKGIGRKLGTDGRWIYSSLGEAPPPPDVWAVMLLYQDAKREEERQKRNQRLNYCAMVHKIYSYYRETFPALSKRAWYELAGRKLNVSAHAVGQAVTEAQQWSAGNAD